jgi:hypothetical protein
MSEQKASVKSWDKKKEELKLEFVRITNKYSMFEGSDYRGISEKLRVRFSKTKQELLKIISAL